MRSRLLFVVLLLALPVVLAQQVLIEPELLSIRQNETAVFELTLSHGSLQTEFFELYSPEIRWDIRPEVSLQVPQGDVFRTRLFVRPLKVDPGTYGIPINVKMSGSRDILRKNVVLEVLPKDDSADSYVPAFKGNASMPKSVDPRQEVRIALDVRNLNSRNLSDVNVKLRSQHFNKDYVMVLDSLQKKSVEFLFRLPERTEPGAGQLQISLLKLENDKTFQYDIAPLKYEVVKYGSIDTDIVVEKHWFLRVFNITLRNTGNQDLRETYVFPSGLFLSLMTSEVPVGQHDGRFITWDVRLKPDEFTKIQVKRNYRVVFGILFFTGLCMLLYFLLRSPLSLRKKISIVSTHEGAIREVKIRLHLKNRGRHELPEVEVHDLLPSIANLVQEYEAGTLRPVKTMESKGGLVLKWVIDTLEPSEERVITYKISARYGIVGRLSLPVAEAKTRLHGRTRRAKSNVARLGQV